MRPGQGPSGTREARVNPTTPAAAASASATNNACCPGSANAEATSRRCMAAGDPAQRFGRIRSTARWWATSCAQRAIPASVSPGHAGRMRRRGPPSLRQNRAAENCHVARVCCWPPCRSQRRPASRTLRSASRRDQPAGRRPHRPLPSTSQSALGAGPRGPSRHANDQVTASRRLPRATSLSCKGSGSRVRGERLLREVAQVPHRPSGDIAALAEERLAGGAGSVPARSPGCTPDANHTVALPPEGITPRPPKA